jgi:hypothetical protein
MVNYVCAIVSAAVPAAIVESTDDGSAAGML